MFTSGKNSFDTLKDLHVGDEKYSYYSLKEVEKHIGDIGKLPFSLKILLENLLRYQDDVTVTKQDIQAIADWQKNKKSSHEIAFRPARVLMQDFTGVPAVADLSAMRDRVVALGGSADKINPLTPVDLVIDHSVMIDHFGTNDSYKKNVSLEFQRNKERYEFLRWGQKAFTNFRVVPPGTGICHQVNIEYLSKTVWHDQDQHGRLTAFPDTLVGTDSHTTMANGLGVLGWGVGGIEAEAGMLGQPISMLIPEVVGFKITGKLKEGMTATDLVLRCVEMLRELGVVGKFVEFYGDGLDNLSLADRATIANMAPEYGATCGIFPIDHETLNYLTLTGRTPQQVRLVEEYAKAQSMWRDSDNEPNFTKVLTLDLSEIEPALAGPKRPQDRVLLSKVKKNFEPLVEDISKNVPVQNSSFNLQEGAVVIAAITSCTNTSNPSVLIGAALVAKKSVELGLQAKPWVKTSLAPGSQVVQDYLEKADLQQYLDHLGFNIVGFGCTTCIGNSGPLEENIARAIDENNLTVCAVLSGNRNFEGRVNPHVKANWLASPPLVVAYAIAGTLNIDLSCEPLGKDKNGNDVYLRDIWPSNQEIADVMEASISPEIFTKRYANVFSGSEEWQSISLTQSQVYAWNPTSTYVQRPPFFDHLTKEINDVKPIKDAKILALLGDSITTDHISPAGSFKEATPAGQYLSSLQVGPKDYNSFGARRGNHEVMVRGTFANIRIKNELCDGVEGGFTKYHGEVMPIFDAAMHYQKNNVDLVIFAGKEYGTGSSRDWAAKGTQLLGVRAVIAESFERIHRSNLVGMGVLPLELPENVTRKTLKLDGSEKVSIDISFDHLTPAQNINVIIERENGDITTLSCLCRIDTLNEVDYYKNGGVLLYVLRNII